MSRCGGEVKEGVSVLGVLEDGPSNERRGPVARREGMPKASAKASPKDCGRLYRYITVASP